MDLNISLFVSIDLTFTLLLLCFSPLHLSPQKCWHVYSISYEVARSRSPEHVICTANHLITSVQSWWQRSEFPAQSHKPWNPSFSGLLLSGLTAETKLLVKRIGNEFSDTPALIFSSRRSLFVTLQIFLWTAWLPRSDRHHICLRRVHAANPLESHKNIRK